MRPVAVCCLLVSILYLRRKTMRFDFVISRKEGLTYLKSANPFVDYIEWCGLRVIAISNLASSLRPTYLGSTQMSAYRLTLLRIADLWRCNMHGMHDMIVFESSNRHDCSQTLFPHPDPRYTTGKYDDDQTHRNWLLPTSPQPSPPPSRETKPSPPLSSHPNPAKPTRLAKPPPLFQTRRVIVYIASL